MYRQTQIRRFSFLKKKKIKTVTGISKHFQKVTNSLNRNLVKNKTQNIQTKIAEENKMLLWTGPWVRTVTVDGMKHKDCKRSLGDAGNGGGSACFCQPTDSDCIFVEVSVGTGHNFY